MKKSFLSCVAILMAFVFNVSVVAQTAPTLEKLTGDEEIYRYYLPQGVAVNKNPASPYFGYTYVAAATNGDASDAGSEYTANQKRGIFVFDAELNSLNPDNVGFLPANAAALMTDVSRQAMHRLAVNPVNNHVVFCYNVEGASAIWSMDPANLAGDAVNLIEGLAITKANAFCFDAEGTLYVMDNANTADGGKLVKVVNGELVTIVQNTIWGNQDLSLASDGRGGLWVAQNRWNIDTYAVLSHVNAAGEVDFAVTKDSPEEVKALFPQDANASYRGQCAYNVDKDILAFGGNKVVALFQVTYDEAGVPSIEKLATTEAIGSNIDGVDFYANGDLAVVSASAERFAKYAVTYPSEEEPENPEIEWIEMPLEITNLTTEVMEVEGAKYLQLMGRDDMNDADVVLFLNNYADVDDDYVVNAENSYMTFGGIELTVLEGVIAQVSDTDKGTIYTGTVRASVEQEGETMYVEFALTMYSAPATELVLTDAIVAINEELGTLTFNVPTGEGEGYFVELAAYTGPGVHEGPQICLFMTPEAVAYTNYAETSVADGVITLKGEFTSPMGPKFDVTISGKLPEVEKPELPAASVRAWAYDLALAVEGEQYTFSYKATTAALATLILTDAQGAELATVDLGLVEAGANTTVLAASELPADQVVNWAVKLEAGAVAELVEVTDQSRGIYDFYNMMDVLVDNNPESEHFGKIYIQQSLNGASDGATDRADTQIAGFFVYDQALNELNPTSNVGIQPILPEGYTMGDARNKFHRLEIDPKTGNLTWCYNIAGQPAVFAVDPANLSGEAANLVAGIEGLSRTSAHCFDAEGALYVYDLPAAGSIFKIVDGVATEFVAPDSKWVQASATMAADGMGGLWVAQNRGQIDTYYQLAHYTKDGALDYAVYQGNENGFSGSSTRGALVYDAERQLLAQGRNGMVEVYSVAYNAETGVPALTLVATTPTVGTNIDGLAFDYAGDLYVVNSSKEKFQKFAMPTENNVCVTPAAAKYAFEIEGATPVEMVGVVKRAVTVGDYIVVLTHEENGAAHLYKVVDGVAVAELSQEGVIAVDAENAGDFLAISDIAATEDGKLVATNKIVCQASDNEVDAGYKRGELRAYIWNDLAGAPSILFTSKMSSNWYRSVQGHTIAYKGTSTNGTLFTTGVTATGVKFRYSVYNVIDGVYTDPAVNDSEHFHFTKGSAQTTDVLGANYQLVASPLAATNWILDGELVDPFEIVDPLTYNTEVTANPALAIDLGKKFNGATILAAEDVAVMVAPYADADGKLAGVKILDITNGLAAAEELQVLALEVPVEATAAATAVNVPEDEDAMYIYLVADATIYTLKAVAEEEEEIDMTIENATATAEGQNIMLNGMWGESNVTISLWQGGATQGYGIYSGEGEGDYYGMVTNPFMQLFPSGDGVYTDNGNGTWTFKAFMTDGSLYYNVTMNGLTSGGGVEIADYITIDNTNIMKEGVMTNFVGYNEYYEVDLVLFGQEYGEYKVVEEDGETIYPIEGFINEVAFVGEGVYSFSDEYNSDLLVATIYVPADGIYYEVTMYTKQVAATDVLIMENMTKEIIEGRWNTNLQLSGVHEEYGNVVITIAGCDGTYGEYAVTATVGDLELEGYGAWQNDGDVDVLNAMLQNADASRVFNVSVSTPYVEDPEPEIIVVEIEDAIFTETEDGLEITGTSLEGQELYLLVGEWATVGYGMYTEFGAVVGTIDGVEVTIMGEDQYAGIEKDEDRAILAAVLTDGTNIYEISAYGTAPMATGVDNISTADAPVKMIENNQLIIIKNGVMYNAQGAIVK